MTTDDPSPERVAAEQVDIDAARTLVGLPADPIFHADDRAVQAFARHRIATAQTSAAEIERLKQERDEAKDRGREFADVAMSNAAVIGQHEITIALAGNELDKAGVPYDDHGDEENRELTLAQRCELVVHYYHEALDQADDNEARALAAEAESARLREGLEPFAAKADEMERVATQHDMHPSKILRSHNYDDCVRARAALAVGTSQEVGRCE